MTDPLKRAVRAAARRLLEPLTRLLIEAGIGVGEFTSIVKASYVSAARDVAKDGAGENIRPNVSRIAVVTGMTRAEVSAILGTDETDAPEPERGRHRAERVLSAWWNDSDYHDERGQPARLALRGGKRSFTSLVKTHAGDPRVQTILEELLRVRAVRRLPDGRFEAMSRTAATARWDPDGIEVVGERLRDHALTLLHNLKHPARPRYERVVVNTQLDPRYAPVLLRDIASQADTLADSFSDALNDPAATQKPTREAQPALRLGVAIYVFEEETEVAPSPSRRGAKGR